jgi:hypothetical protein
MNKDKRNALKKAGFRIGNAEDFLELTKEERQLVDLRVLLSKTVRRIRAMRHLNPVNLGSPKLRPRLEMYL